MKERHVSNVRMSQGQMARKLFNEHLERFDLHAILRQK
jgi:hypothetical protein